MPDAQAEHDRQVDLYRVQDFSLNDGTAHRLQPARTSYLLFFRDAYPLLGSRPYLAPHGNHLEPLVLQNIGQDAGFIGQSGAEGNPEPVVVTLVGKLNKLLHPRYLRPPTFGKLFIALEFLHRGEAGKLPHFRPVIFGDCLVDNFRHLLHGAKCRRLSDGRLFT